MIRDRMGPQSGQQPTRKAPDSNRNRCYAVIPPSCGPTFRTRFYREPVRCTWQRAEIEARDDGCDRLAQSRRDLELRARETAWPATRQRAWPATRQRARAMAGGSRPARSQPPARWPLRDESGVTERALIPVGPRNSVRLNLGRRVGL